MTKIQSTLQLICKIIFFVCGSIMVILLTVNGLGRYIFSRGIVWADEVTRLMFVWGSFTGITYALVTDGHIGFDFIASRTKLTKKISDLLNALCTIVIGFVVMRYGQIFIARVGGVPLPASGLPIRFLYSAGVVAGISWILVGIWKMANLFLEIKNGGALTEAEGGESR